MKVERTFSIIKPNAVIKNVIGTIINRFERIGLMVVAIKMLELSRAQAENFYFEHKYKPFFNDLVNFMISGPIVIQVLEGKDAIRRNREIMGATNPDLALIGTLRADYADSVIKNAVHGSDSYKSAKREISFFFSKEELHIRNY